MTSTNPDSVPFDTEALREQIPSYLSSEDQRALVSEIRTILAGGASGFVLSGYNDRHQAEMLQGDGWRGFQLFLFDSGERKSVRGMVISNSCDVDPNNPRDLPARITFAPLVKLSKFIEALERSGVSQERIDAKIKSIKAQGTTNIFYVPAGGALDVDHIVKLDDAHSMPVRAHLTASDREKMFTLSNAGFYLLILKLSIHFCRLQEKISRNSGSVVQGC